MSWIDKAALAGLGLVIGVCAFILIAIATNDAEKRERYDCVQPPRSGVWSNGVCYDR